MNREKAEYYRKKPNHKYMVVNYARNPIIEKFFYTEDEAMKFLRKYNGEIIGSYKAKLKVEETNYYKGWKAFNGIVD